MMTVTAVGPDCRELQKDDIAIIPKRAGTMITVLEGDIPKRVFVITEDAVLARYRED